MFISFNIEINTLNIYLEFYIIFLGKKLSKISFLLFDYYLKNFNKSWGIETQFLII